MLAVSTNIPRLLGSYLGAAGNANVAALQQVMKDLAKAANNPAGDPGAVDGVVGLNTLLALALWVPKLPKVPGAVGTALNLIALAGAYAPASIVDPAKNLVTSYAAELTTGLKATLLIYTAVKGGAPTPPSTTINAQPALYLQNMAIKSGSTTSSNTSLTPEQQAALATQGSKYKAGSVARFNKTRSVWSVYSPLAGGLGLGVTSDGRCVGGDCLGDGEVTPPVPTGFVKAGEEVIAPTGVPNAGEESDKTPFFSAKNPLFWAAIGGTVVVVGGGYVLLRRKRAA